MEIKTSILEELEVLKETYKMLKMAKATIADSAMLHLLVEGYVNKEITLEELGEVFTQFAGLILNKED